MYSKYYYFFNIRHCVEEKHMAAYQVCLNLHLCHLLQKSNTQS